LFLCFGNIASKYNLLFYRWKHEKFV
jgi:hypothetical protein